MKLKYSDKAHGYWLDGKRTKSVTAVVGLPDDKSQLNSWKMRQVIIGLAAKPGLLKDLDTSDRAKGNSVIDAAMSAAGSSDAADYGTHAHKVTEDADRGLPIEPMAQSIADRYQALMFAAGLTIVPELIEGVVVFPEERICGRFDRIARRDSDNAAVVVDVKTGMSAVNYPHSTCAQLAMYANAPLRCDIGAEGDGETDVFFELPTNMDREIGYVISMPSDGNDAVYTVNLRLGWACVQQIILPGLRWRAMKKSDLIRKVA